MTDEKRLFFGLEVVAPWPSAFPRGRVLDEASRHITLAFLGNVDYAKLQRLLGEIPLPEWEVGQVGFFEKCTFLPKHAPRVVAWDPGICGGEKVTAYQKRLTNWLRQKEYVLDTREFLCHMTIARAPFEKEEWKRAFTPLPFYTSHLHLYESLGNSKYQILWTHKVHPPFEEMEHVADIAFRVYDNIYLHAEIALAFKCPEIKKYLHLDEKKESISEIVIALNDAVARIDAEIGSPFKAVSFHGDIHQQDGLKYWEMIVDV